MKINEILDHKKHFVGTCTNAFDDGECIVDNLPWRNATDFAQAEENSHEISKEDFLKATVITDALAKKLVNHQLHFLVADDVYMIYDDNLDVHYFFV